jgi:hypothetical protein
VEIKITMTMTTTATTIMIMMMSSGDGEGEERGNRNPQQWVSLQASIANKWRRHQDVSLCVLQKTALGGGGNLLKFLLLLQLLSFIKLTRKLVLPNSFPSLIFYYLKLL